MSLTQNRYFAGLKAIPPGHFLARLNGLVSAGQPAIFYVDYQGDRGKVLTMPEAHDAGVLFKEGLRKSPSTRGLVQKLEIISAPSAAQYREAFEKIQEYLRAGESWLVNLSFATQVSLPDEPAKIFPYLTASLCLYVPNEFLCFTPEKFIEISDNKISTRPMKGTFEVLDQANDWQSDHKEIAEHYTVTDLLRNDLGMVGRHVKVEKFRYSEHIHTGQREIIQTSSLITAELPQRWQEHVAEIIYTLLPAGSVTGAPKARTLQIIDAVENHKRGFYTGIAGYFDGKALRTWVLIRFIEISQENFFYKSGGGITLYSQCDKEYSELLKKIYLPVVTA